MNLDYITISTLKGDYKIPNRWDLLTQKQFLQTLSLVSQWQVDKLSVIEVLSNYVCMVSGLRYHKVVRHPDAAANLYVIATQIDFIFRYNEDLKQYELRPPMFATQFFPYVKLCRQRLVGYSINRAQGVFSTNLSALQFIDAVNLLKDRNKHILVFCILFHPVGLCYDPDAAVLLADKLEKRLSAYSLSIIDAVLFQFAALVSYIFALPHYEILCSKEKKTSSNPFSTGMEAALYNLCQDGLGTAAEIERMPVFKFLDLMRKKLIESIRTMAASKMDIMDIAEKTDIPVQLITRILS